MFSFTKRKQQVDVQQHIRRIIDRTGQKTSLADDDARMETRSNRTMPVLLCPCEGNEPRRDGIVTGLTKDFSGNGVSVILQQPWLSSDVAVVFCCEGSLKCFRGEVKVNRSFGGEFWQLGIELVDLFVAGDHDALRDTTALMALLDPVAS